MKKFTVPCEFGSVTAPFDVYIGQPTPGFHPLAFQARWLAVERGGVLPPRVMDSFAKLLELADKNGVEFEELCVEALRRANPDRSEEG